ncbi:TIGR03790 family protein [Luteolibacter sp. GHJ8]|uniref:TIGR03790 family protein n=1 Tax=Luteolibacter rhizosphaerae TaxID=2989719 RepID=A0ABT3G197_9BACT|nr:TIGR03790 family protein [Luteolibacter rhizosphaerae]MCW1913609.1 TIGR03790 family protein [Luteolibacter rhizosphaerae]
MIRQIGLLMCLIPALQAAPAVPVPESVAVLYNSSSSESKAIATYYAEARKIPEENLVGLPMPEKEEVSREEFNTRILEPLKAEYDKRGWWKRQEHEGKLIPISKKIRVIACIYGVPSRVAAQPNDPKMVPGGAPPLNTTEAAVDSELALIGNEDLPLPNALINRYFKQDLSVFDTNMSTTLVGRIDGPSRAICERMIRDAVEVEKTGLWGMAVIDIAKKYTNTELGDPWLESIARANRETGIPTLVDRFQDTLPTNFPLRDVVSYYGWYDWNVSGPFLNPTFRFKKGAVAVHLHSFSAAQLRDPGKNWCAPLLARGAAATLGNVHEPYLEMTHHFDIFQARLKAGYTLVEAAYMAVPVMSWQNVVLGDPLYRPYLHIDGTGDKAEADREYRAIRLATMRWQNDPRQLDAMLREGADRLKSGVIMESLGLMKTEQRMTAEAAVDFQRAKVYYTAAPDRLRMDLHIAAIDRAGGRNDSAISILRGARTLYANLPEAVAAQAWLNVIDPPSPPPAQPKK